MAAQGLAPHSSWQNACLRQRCFTARMVSPSRVFRVSLRVPLVRAHASVESIPRKTRPGEKKGVRLLCDALMPCVRGSQHGLTLMAASSAEHSLRAGFVEEMRFVAMRLHTKDQAPKEGGQKAAEQPFQKVTLQSVQSYGFTYLTMVTLVGPVAASAVSQWVKTAPVCFRSGSRPEKATCASWLNQRLSSRP